VLLAFGMLFSRNRVVRASCAHPPRSIARRTSSTRGPASAEPVLAVFALARLVDNGGPTPTYLPGAGSIAIDEGRESHCKENDQRHFPITDRSCDVGAVEAGAAPAPDAGFADGFE
jgi:hypothetical protein